MVAVCDREPEVPVTVSVYMPFAVFLFELPPEHAAKVMQITIADSVTRRMRRRCVDRSRKMSISARKSGTIRKKFNGGAGLEIGKGTSIPCAVNVSVEVVGGVMEDGLSKHDEFVGAPLQASATAALKPFEGFTEIVTGAPTAP